jgi:hypothetical protein
MDVTETVVPETVLSPKLSETVLRNCPGLPGHEPEDIIRVDFNGYELHDRFAMFRNNDWLTALRNLIHHSEALRLELRSWNLLHTCPHPRQYSRNNMTTLNEQGHVGSSVNLGAVKPSAANRPGGILRELLLQDHDEAFTSLRMAEGIGRPLGTPDFVIELERLGGRSLARRAPGRKPVATPEGDRLKLLQ